MSDGVIITIVICLTLIISLYILAEAGTDNKNNKR